MSKSSKINKPPVVEKLPISWEEQVSQIDLNTIHACRAVKIALLNADTPNYTVYIDMCQNYAYIQTVKDVKPIIFEEILYIIKYYPGWSRPYVPQAIENYFQQACIEAKLHVRRQKPIPPRLMVNLIKLRIILMIYEDIYLETNNINQSPFYDLNTDVTPCSSRSETSNDEEIFEEESDALSSEQHSLSADAIGERSESEYDRDTMNLVYNFSSPILQGYVTAMQQHFRRDSNTVKLHKESRKKDLIPWVVRYCKEKKSGKSKIMVTVSKKNVPAVREPTFKQLYMVLVGFYDVMLVKELHNVGVDLYCVIIFGGEDVNVTLQPRTSDPFLDTTSKCINPVYYFTALKKKSTSRKHLMDDEYSDLKESLILMFWVKMEELCETNLSYTKDVIWFYYPVIPLTQEEGKFGTNQYWKYASNLFRVLSQYLYSIVYLGKYHRLYLRSLDIHDLGEKPKVVPVGKMFHYNEALRPIPPECIKVGHILEGLLTEVYHKAVSSSSIFPIYQPHCEMEISKNKKKKKLVNRLLKKFKFSYMPADPIVFFHTRPYLIGLLNNTEIKRDIFDTYDSNVLELEAHYYPKLRNRLKTLGFEHLKNSFPALLWHTYEYHGDFQDRMMSSHVYQTWLSFIKLSARECQERLAIKMCDTIDCKGRTKIYRFCTMHNYFVKPLWVYTAIYSPHINKKTGKISVSTPQKKTEKRSGRFPNDFHWQEHLSPEIFLQQTLADFTYYDCFDHSYIPFLDQIVVRFHDPTDDFGASVYIWEESIRSPVSLYNFFKHSIFEDSKWLRQLEDALASLKLLPRNVESLSQKTNGEVSETSSLTFAEFSLPSVTSFDDVFLNTPHTTFNSALTAFNLEDRAGVGGTTTIFHSTEGLKVTVNVSRIFSVRVIELLVQGDDQSFILHANPASPFMFHFLTSNDIRIVFCKPEAVNIILRDEVIAKKQKPTTKKAIYLMKETYSISFAKRSKFTTKRYLSEQSLKNMIETITTQNKSYSSIESLKNVESGHKVTLKTAKSLTNISKGANRPPAAYEDVFKDLHNVKRKTIPHFRILSSALHKRKYVVVSPAKIILKFADYSIPIKFKPNINMSKRIEFSKCPGLDLPFQDVDPPKELQTKYDIRISMPSGLQISTIPDPEDPSKCLVIQNYITTGPLNASIQQEMSRTFTKQGYIRIKYHDGSIKMIGINGKTATGKVPCLNRKVTKRKSKVFTENIKYHKYVRLQKNIHRKINRFQRRIIDVPGAQYLNQQLTKRDKYFKALLDEFVNNPCSIDHTKLTVRQLLSPIICKIEQDSFKDHNTNNFCTNDSFTSINDDGEQVTTFTDGTKITSWFKIEQEMIVIPLDAQYGKLEVDVDDYTCNFLVPKTGAWVDVKLSLQYEHPQYATVVYRADGAEVSICLPNDAEVKIKSDGTYFINVGDCMYANISTEEIKIRSNFCKKCYDSCETNIYIKDLYDNNENVLPNEVLLEAKDNFNKYFKVEYCGVCSRNKDYNVGAKKSCIAHRFDTMEKFYSFDRSFKGIAYWTNAMFMNRVLSIQDKHNKEHVKYYLDEKQILRAYEITIYATNHYCDRFLMPYRKGDPPALKGFNPSPKPNCFGQIAYKQKRLVELLPDPETIMPLLNVINEWKVCRPWELHLPTKEMLVPPVKPKQYVVSSTENINLRLPPYFAETAIEHFKELNDIANSFKIGLFDNVDSFTKVIGKSVCKCIKKDKEDQSGNELNTVSEKYSYGTSKNRLKMAWSYIDSPIRLPPVPANSMNSTILTRDSYGTVLFGGRDLPQDPSVLEFSAEPLQRKSISKYICTSQFNKASSTKSIERPGALIANLFHPGTFEWRKANMQESSTTTTSENQIPIKMDMRRRWKRLKDKATTTVQPFDLLGLQELKSQGSSTTLRQINESTNSRESTKELQLTSSTGFSMSKWDNRSVDGVDDILQPVSDLRCCETANKKSFTEIKKSMSSKTQNKTTEDKELPLILNRSSLRNTQH